MTPKRAAINLLGMLVMVLAVTQVEAQVSGGIGRMPNYPEVPVNNQREIIISREISNNRIDLSMYLDQGISLDSITVVGRSLSQRTGLHLVVNSRLEDSSYDIFSSAMLRMISPIRVDRYRDRIELEVNGSVFIDRLIINSEIDRRDGRDGRDGRHDDRRDRDGRFGRGAIELEARVFEHMRGLDVLQIDRLVNLHAYRGYRIESITVVGSSRRGHGRGEILINRMSAGSVFFGIYQTTETVRINDYRNVIGMDVHYLELETRGNIIVDRVIVRVVR